VSNLTHREHLRRKYIKKLRMVSTRAAPKRGNPIFRLYEGAPRGPGRSNPRYCDRLAWYQRKGKLPADQAATYKGYVEDTCKNWSQAARHPRPERITFLDDKYQSLISLETRLFVAAASETISGHAAERAEQHTMRAGWRLMGKSAKALS
jgi:hypothetical protein